MPHERGAWIPERVSYRADALIPQTARTASGTAVVVLDSRGAVIGFSQDAADVLCHPVLSASECELFGAVAEQVRRLLGKQPAASGREWTADVFSGRRRYRCHAVRADGLEGTYTVLRFERVGQDPPSLVAICAKFRLTERESEAVTLLALGLTNKEIAARMTVSVNTIKAFLHLVMSKMGVSTRAGIVGRVLGQ